jgi:hypothetical protein
MHTTVATLAQVQQRKDSHISTLTQLTPPPNVFTNTAHQHSTALLYQEYAEFEKNRMLKFQNYPMLKIDDPLSLH